MTWERPTIRETPPRWVRINGTLYWRACYVCAAAALAFAAMVVAGLR